MIFRARCSVGTDINRTTNSWRFRTKSSGESLNASHRPTDGEIVPVKHSSFFSFFTYIFYLAVNTRVYANLQCFRLRFVYVCVRFALPRYRFRTDNGSIFER